MMEGAIVSTRSRTLLIGAAVALLTASLLPPADAAPAFLLKQFKIPTANSSPKSITKGSDGNFWFTESHVNPPQSINGHPLQPPETRATRR
jgi:hypothetical protein